MYSLIFLAPVLLAATVCRAEDGSDDADGGEEWIDPFDMLNYSPEGTAPKRAIPKPAAAETIPSEGTSPTKGKDLQDDISNLKSKLSQCEDKNMALRFHQQQRLQTCSGKSSKTCDTPYFKKLARTLLKTAESLGHRTVSFGLNPYEAQTLKEFVDSEKGSVQDASEVIINILSGVEADNSGYMDMLSSPYFNQHTIMIVIAILGTIVVFIVLETSIRLTWRQQFFFIIGVCIISSIPWEWYRMYRTAFAIKQSEMMKDMPKHCQPEHQLGPMESLSLLITKSFTFSEDSCVKYQESLLVDPLWEVSPVRALSVTITVFFIQPLEYIAEAAGKSFSALFRGVPVQWQPFVFMAVMIFVILVLFLISGVQVRLPFVTIGTGYIAALPGNVDTGNQLARLQQHVQDLGAEVRNIVPAIQQNGPQAVQAREGLPALQQAVEYREGQQNVMEQNIEQLLHGMEAVMEMQVRQEGQLKQTQEALDQRNAPLPCENAEERRPHGGMPVQDTAPSSVEDVGTLQ